MPTSSESEMRKLPAGEVEEKFGNSSKVGPGLLVPLTLTESGRLEQERIDSKEEITRGMIKRKLINRLKEGFITLFTCESDKRSENFVKLIDDSMLERIAEAIIKFHEEDLVISGLMVADTLKPTVEIGPIQITKVKGTVVNGDLVYRPNEGESLLTVTFLINDQTVLITLKKRAEIKKTQS